MGLETRLRDEGYSEEEVRAIVRRAAELQAGAGGRMDREMLEASASEAGIAPEYIREAAGQIRAERVAARRRRRTGAIVAIALLALLAMFLIVSYNTLRGVETRVEQARAQLETVLQRRFDLIPNLVRVTREYAQHEQQVFTALAEARNRFQAARTLEEQAAADAQLQAVLPRLLAIVESNPELRASDLYLRLQDELAGTENRIAVARRRYNEAVADYNRTANSFPMVTVRGLLGFEASKPYFQAAPGAERAPDL
jgi:LemA protein